jgi:hypothetical protein
MEQKSDKQFIDPLLKKLRTFQYNNRCLYPGCSHKPIRSHVIAESILEQIADNEAKVLTWNPSDNDIAVGTMQGHEWEQVYKKPIRVGIRQETTYPIFCHEHDNGIFAELEDHDFSFSRQHVALLAYRALCYKTWNPKLEQKLEFLLSNKDADTKLQQERIFSIKTMIAARQKLENMLAARDYKELCWISRILPVDPFLACTDTTMPYEGEEDAKNIANGNISLIAEDIMTFSLFPEKKLNASVCVITWFRGNSRITEFIENFGFGSLPDEAIADNIIHNALRLSLVYASPAWWDTLPPEQQEYVWESQVSKIRFTLPKFRPN